MLSHIFTVRKQSCRKIMFSQVCVKNSVHRGNVYPSNHWAGGCVSQQSLGRGVCIPACTKKGVSDRGSVYSAAQGGCLLRGVPAQGGSGLSTWGMYTPLDHEADTPKFLFHQLLYYVQLYHTKITMLTPTTDRSAFRDKSPHSPDHTPFSTLIFMNKCPHSKGSSPCYSNCTTLQNQLTTLTVHPNLSRLRIHIFAIFITFINFNSKLSNIKTDTNYLYIQQTVADQIICYSCNTVILSNNHPIYSLNIKFSKVPHLPTLNSKYTSITSEFFLKMRHTKSKMQMFILLTIIGLKYYMLHTFSLSKPVH